MSDYWKNRFEQVEQSSHDLAIEYYEELEKNYRLAMREVENQISTWIRRFAENNNITVEEARRLLNTKELKEFLWDVQEYIKHGEENALDQSWMKELENASARFHINRLEALKLHVRQQLEILMGGMVDDIDSMLREVYKETYYRSAFEIQKGVGIGFDVGKVDEKQLATIIKKPWSVDGQNFSEKVWLNKTKLINVVNQELSKMVMTGSKPDKAIKAIEKAMNTSRANATRLVMTEQAYFTSLAQKDTYKDLDVEQVEIVATLDGLTCSECGSKDGEHFPVKIMDAGINVPPFHPYCRCTTCPYFDDMGGYRASRNGDGKTVYEVPANMKYSEWNRMFVSGTKNPEKHLKQSNINDNGVIFLWNDDFSKEAQKSYTDTFNKLSEMYPLENVKVDAVGDIFDIRKWSRNFPDDKLREDIVWEKLGYNFGAQYMPEGLNILPSRGAFIEIADNERSVIKLEDWFKQMHQHRLKTGTPKTLADCFFNVGEGTEAIMTHEYGHAIASNYEFYGSNEDAKWLRDIFNKYDELEIAKELSIYATKSHDEFFAECFVKSFDKYSDSKIAKEVMNEFRKRYNIKRN